MEIGSPLRQFFSRPAVIALLGLTFTVAWLFGWRGFIGVPGQWGEKPNAAFWPWGAWPLPIGVLVIFGGAAVLSVYDRYRRAKTRKEQRNSIFTALAALMLLNLLLPGALLGPGYTPPIPKGQTAPSTSNNLLLEGRANIIASLWSDVSTEYFGTAYEIRDARQFSREYAGKWQKPRSTSLAHVATHPPGATLFFYAIRRTVESVPALSTSLNSAAATLTQMSFNELYDLVSLMRETASRSAGEQNPTVLPRSAIGVALLSAVLLNLALTVSVPAVYGLAALGAPDEATADSRGLMAAALFVLAPNLNLFAFTLDALLACGIVWTLYLVALGVQKNNRVWIWLSGVVFSLTAFISIGVLACGLIVVLGVVLHRRAQSRSALPEIAHWLLGGLLGAALLWLIFPFQAFAVVSQAMAAHRFATIQYRQWLPWFFLNFVLFILFCGWATVAGLLTNIIPAWRSTNRHAPALAIGIATLATIVLLSLSGNVRGEVERLWLFLLAPLAATAFFQPNWRTSTTLIAVQAIQTLVMAATLAPLVRPY